MKVRLWILAGLILYTILFICFNIYYPKYKISNCVAEGGVWNEVANKCKYNN